MKLKEALFKFYHLYKDTPYLNDLFILRANLLDYCSDSTNKKDALLYLDLLQNYNIFNIITKEGITTGINTIKESSLYNKYLLTKPNSSFLSYTISMLDEEYIDIKESIYSKNIHIRKHVVHNKRTIKTNIKVNRITRPKVNSVPCLNRLVFYNVGGPIHINPLCKHLDVTKNIYTAKEKTYHNKVKLCPYCGNDKIIFNIVGTGVTLYKAICDVIIKANLYFTYLIYKMYIIVEKLQMKGQNQILRFGNLKWSYTKGRNYYHVKLTY